jgi:hypothetical protein
MTIQIDDIVFENDSQVVPRVAGCVETTIYLSKRPFFDAVFPQRMTENRWWPEVTFECPELFAKGGRPVPPDARFIIPTSWEEVKSSIFPKGFTVAPGTYRLSLVFSTSNPLTTKPQDLDCWVIHSKEFTLEREGYHRPIHAD